MTACSKRWATPSRRADFRKTAKQLGESGLDIMFVFDSTQSMDEVLDQTKQRIATMVDVLHGLVPNARMGIITYRDHGDSEEYLARQIPLGKDYYRAINFMQSVFANGGGDTPEAVYDALRLATKQRWRRGAKRMIVLIGDAPAHREDQKRVDRIARDFARIQLSHIHAIMTERNSDGIDPRCRANFEEIAKSGRGNCIPLTDEATILNEVMSLAFGAKHRRNIDSIYKIVEKRRAKTSARALDLVRREDFEKLRLALTKPTVDDELIQALSKSRSKSVATFLVDLLRTGKTPKHARHAISYALRRILNLILAPVDPDSETPLTTAQAQRLKARIERDLD